MLDPRRLAEQLRLRDARRAGGPVKVAHIHVSFGSRIESGTHVSVPNTCSLLEEQGISTCVLYGTEVGQPAAVPGRTTHHLPGLTDFRTRSDLALIRRALKTLHDEKVDAVHVHQTEDAELLDAVANEFPTFYFVHNQVLTCPSILHVFQRERVFQREWHVCPLPGPAPACFTNAYLHRCNSLNPRTVLRSIVRTQRLRGPAARILLGVDSNFMKRSLVNSGFDDARIVVTPTVTEVKPEPPDDYPMSGPPRVLYVGQVTEFKGLAVLIDAVAQSKDVELDIVGFGAFEAMLTQQVNRQGLGDRVTIHGVLPREKVEPLMRRACCAVVPSIWPEPFGVVGPEAMAAARPVIGSNIGGIPEWLDDGVCGYLVAPNDPNALARRIADLANDRSRSRQMGLAGRRQWEERFHPRLHVAMLLEVYDTIIRNFKAVPVGT